MLLLVKLQPEACSFTKSNFSLWVFFTFLNCTNGTKSRWTFHIFVILYCELNHSCLNNIFFSLIIIPVRKYPWSNKQKHLMFCFTVFLIKLIMTSVPAETSLSWSIDFFNFTFLFFFQISYLGLHHLEIKHSSFLSFAMDNLILIYNEILICL